MLFSIFQSDSHGNRHPAAHLLARELDVNAVCCKEVASRRNGAKSPRILREAAHPLLHQSAACVPTTSASLALLHPHLPSRSIQRASGQPRRPTPCFLPAQHYDRLIVRDLRGPKVCPDLGPCTCPQMAFLSSFQVRLGPANYKVVAMDETPCFPDAACLNKHGTGPSLCRTSVWKW